MLLPNGAETWTDLVSLLELALEDPPRDAASLEALVISCSRVCGHECDAAPLDSLRQALGFDYGAHDAAILPPHDTADVHMLGHGDVTWEISHSLVEWALELPRHFPSGKIAALGNGRETEGEDSVVESLALPRHAVRSLLAHMLLGTVAVPPGAPEIARPSFLGILGSDEPVAAAKVACIIAYFVTEVHHTRHGKHGKNGKHGIRDEKNHGGGAAHLEDKDEDSHHHHHHHHDRHDHHRSHDSKEEAKLHHPSTHITLEIHRNRLKTADLVGMEHPTVAASVARVSSEDRIEDHRGGAWCVFSNRIPHKLCVTADATQEEIMFSIVPELHVVMLACCGGIPDDGVIVVHGAHRYSVTAGYRKKFRFVNRITSTDRTPGPHAVILMDAVDVTAAAAAAGARENPSGPFHPLRTLERDLGKAVAGFGCLRVTVSTGCWGCGVFGGDPCLKFAQQCVAASLCNVRLRYSVFGDAALGESLERVRVAMEGLSVGEVWQAVVQAAEDVGGRIRGEGGFKEALIDRLCDRDVVEGSEEDY